MPRFHGFAPAEDRLDHAHGVDALDDVVHPDDPRPEHRADGGGGQRSGQPRTTGAPEGLPHEVLVRHRGEHRVAERDDLGQPPGQLERVHRVLVEVVPGVDHDPRPGDARGERPVHPLAQEVHDRAGDVVVGRGRRQLLARWRGRVRDDDGGVGVRDHGRHPRVGQSGGVVDDAGTGGDRRRRDLGPERVDRDHDVGLLGEPGHDRQDPVDLVLGGQLRAGRELHPADVDPVRALFGCADGGLDGAVEREGGALVVERVRCAVHDRHDGDAVVEVEGAPTDRADRVAQVRHDPARSVGRKARGALLVRHASAPWSAAWSCPAPSAAPTPAPISAIASARPAASARVPVAATVTVDDPDCRSPRAVTHWWVASSTTRTPAASSPSATASATCSPRRSCSCGREATASSTRDSVPSPMSCCPGAYARCATPVKGSRWCSHIERNRTSRTTTSCPRSPSSECTAPDRAIAVASTPMPAKNST
ncbi:hypothetical protein Cus16_2840 [Curtobacterium sp. ER1/6]|nr:hypothetical protein Cus16_2840 [Curtobacterium sp. ER1/6]